MLMGKNVGLAAFLSGALAIFVFNYVNRRSQTPKSSLSVSIVAFGVTFLVLITILNALPSWWNGPKQL